MKELLISITKTIIGWIFIIIIIIEIKKYFKKKEIKEQLRNLELQRNNTKKNKYIEKTGNNAHYKINNNIFTNAEQLFYKVLKHITDKMELNILTKVRLADIIYTNSNEYKYFNKIKAKHIDFVLIDKDGNIKLLIELDDKSHENNERKKRDKFLNEIFENQKIKLLRIPVKYSYNTIKLEEMIKESI